MKYSNARTEAEVDNWPSGGRRVTAIFYLESNSRGERISRITTGKPKNTNYYRRIRIVDTEDGKVALLAHTDYNQIVIIPGTLQHREYLHEGDDNYQELKELLYA